jgi:hypothetical protein
MHRVIYFSAAILSLLLSGWMIATSSIINPDGICYLQSAEMMKNSFSDAMHLCGQAKWPFYSFLIYSVSKWTSFSDLNSAYFLDAVLSLISVLTFIAIVGTLTTSKRILWLAAAVILLSHEFNALRIDIVRDHGFWAFYLLSILFLIKFTRTNKFLFALAFSASLMIATLFRVEAVVFLLLVPFITFFSEKSFVNFLKLNCLTFLLIAGAAGYVLLHRDHSLGRLDEIQFQLSHGAQWLAQTFQTRTDALAKYVLTTFSAGDAKLVFVLMLLSWYVASVAINLSVIYAILVVYAWMKKLISHPVLWAYVTVNVLITAIFLAQNMYISKRYLIALSLVLMVWVPFALEFIIQQRKKWLTAVVIFFIFISSLGGIFSFGPSKEYIREAGLWVSANVPKSATFYSNDYQVLYYSNHFGLNLFATAQNYLKADVMAKDAWKQYDYLAMRTRKNETLSAIPLKPVAIFKNKRGDAVMIFEKRRTQ